MVLGICCFSWVNSGRLIIPILRIRCSNQALIHRKVITEIISERNLYGLGVDPENDAVHVTDAVAFQGNGKVYVFDFSGNKLDEYGVGRGPRDFVFKNVK